MSNPKIPTQVPLEDSESVSPEELLDELSTIIRETLEADPSPVETFWQGKTVRVAVSAFLMAPANSRMLVRHKIHKIMENAESSLFDQTALGVNPDDPESNARKEKFVRDHMQKFQRNFDLELARRYEKAVSVHKSQTDQTAETRTKVSALTS